MIGGDSDWWLRLPSVVFAASSVPVFFVLAKRLVSVRSSISGAGLVALSPALMHHAQEARSYSLTVLLVLLGWLAALRLSDAPSQSARRWYVAVAVAAVYAHFIAILFVAAQLAWLFAAHRREAFRSGAWISVLVLPQLALIVGPQAHGPGWIQPLSAGQIGDMLRYLAGTELQWVAAMVVSTWIIGGHAALTRTGSESRAPVAWVVLPFFGLLAVSAAVSPMFVERYLVMLVPGAVLLVCIAADTFPRLGTVVVASLTLISALGLHSTLTRDEPDWRSATHLLLAESDSNEAVLFVRSRHLVEHYWDQAGRPPSVPVALSEPGDWGSVRRTYDSDVRAALGRLRDAQGAWVVDRRKPFALTAGEQQILTEIEERWPDPRVWTLDDGAIVIKHYADAT